MKKLHSCAATASCRLAYTELLRSTLQSDHGYFRDQTLDATAANLQRISLRRHTKITLEGTKLYRRHILTNFSVRRLLAGSCKDSLIDHIISPSSLYNLQVALCCSSGSHNTSKASCSLTIHYGSRDKATVVIQYRFLPCCRCGGAQSQWLGEWSSGRRRSQFCRVGTAHLS